MSNWNYFPETTPTDGQYVYIRLNYRDNKSFLAQWNESLQQFVSVDNSIVFPAWSVTRWQEINPALIFGIGSMYVGITFIIQ